MITKEQEKNTDTVEKLNWAIDQTAAWMLELTKLKQEIEKTKPSHLVRIK